MIILTIATLRRYNACHLNRGPRRGEVSRVTAFRRHHGHAPGRRPTLRSWLACTPDVRNWIWATRCLGREGRILALEVATRAARRTMVAIGWDYTADPRPLRAIEAAEAILAEWWAGREPTEEMRGAAMLAADDADTADAPAAYYVALAAAADDAAAYAAAAVGVEAAAAAYSAAGAHYAAADAYLAKQRADYLDALDRLESPDAR